MHDVLITGIGQTQVGEHWDISLKDLAYDAIEKALLDASGLAPGAVYVGNGLSQVLSHQAHLGAMIADYAGLSGAEALTVEAAGASGGAALRMGYLAVASGEVEVALVVGVEKNTDQIGPQVEAAHAMTGDSDFEAIQGLTPTAQAALLMKRYMQEFDVPHRGFAGFPVVAHANAASNPNAMYRSPISAETYVSAGLVSDPLNMFDAAPNADGAAAVILTRPDLLPPGYPHRSVRIAASAMATASLALHDRPDPLDFRAARLSVERACRKAGILPADIDLFELYDAYSIFAALSLEAAGFADRGQGWKLTHDGQIGLNGAVPVSTFGGLKARGNPGGATGIYQAVEAVLQLRGQAGPNQVTGAQKALIQCLGGPASTAVTHVLDVLQN